MRLKRHLCWIVALVLLALPILVALDYGGVLSWTQSVVAGVLAVAVTTALIVEVADDADRNSIRRFLWRRLPSLILMAISLSVAALCIPIPREIVSFVSPASAESHLNWGQGLLSENFARRIPISIAPLDSLHVAAWLTIMTSVAFIIPTVFDHPNRSTALLASVAIYGGVISAIGIARQSCPGFALWSFHQGGEGSPFGTFLNRNNAALGMNLGLAGCFATFVARQCRVTSKSSTSKIQSPLGVIGDPIAGGALALGCLCIAGLIFSGSRGGMLAMSLSIFVTAVLFRSALKALAMPTFLALTGFVAFLVFDYFRATDSVVAHWTSPSTLESITERIGNDARLQHWPDGLRAAMAYFPFGSGAASYGYAYLPCQESSPWRWFTHGENLWLEVLVETSVIGGLGTLLCFGLLLKASFRLRHRVNNDEPQSLDKAMSLDQAFSAASVFLIVCLLVSQTLDFGLILPANSMVLVLLASAIWSRSCRQVFVLPTSHPRSQPLSQNADFHDGPLRNRKVWLTIPMIIAVTIGWEKLHRDSVSDSAARTIDHSLAVFPTDLERLTSLSHRWLKIAEQSPTPSLLRACVDLEFQRGRLLELDQQRIDRMPKLRRELCYSITSQNYRRLAWRRNRCDLSYITRGGRALDLIPPLDQASEAASAYRNAWRLTRQSLRCRPLAIEPRFHLVALEFVHQEPGRSKLALQQARRLFHNTPELQLRVATMFADHGDDDQAIIAFRRAAELSPNRMHWVFGKAKRYASLPLERIIPENEKARSAAKAYLRSRSLN